MSFSINRALAQAFQMISSRFGAMLAISALVMVLSWIVMGSYMGTMAGTLMTNPGMGEQMLMRSMGAGVFFVYLVSYAISLTGDAATCALCSDQTDHTIGTALGVGVRAMPGLFGAWLLFAIGMVAVGLVMMLTLSGIIYAGESFLLNFVAVIGMFAVFAYLGTKVSLVLPVMAIDEVRNPVTAIGRSWALTSGNTLKVFLLYFLVMGAIGVIGLVLFIAVIGTPQPGQMPSFGALGFMMVGFVVLSIAIRVFFTALVAAVHRQLAGSSSSMADAFV